jgi:hypothetical protein
MQRGRSADASVDRSDPEGEIMNRSKALALSAAVLVAGAVGCAQYNAGPPVRVVRNSADVSSCQKVVDVKVDSHLSPNDVIAEAADQARDKGADTLLLAEGANTGAGFRCATPSVASK